MTREEWEVMYALAEEKYKDDPAGPFVLAILLGAQPTNGLAELLKPLEEEKK